jgi:hypothetical protein
LLTATKSVKFRRTPGLIEVASLPLGQALGDDMLARLTRNAMPIKMRDTSRPGMIYAASWGDVDLHPV